MSYLYTETKGKKTADQYQELLKYDPTIVGSKEDQLAFKLALLIAQKMSNSFFSLAESMEKNAGKFVKE